MKESVLNGRVVVQGSIRGATTGGGGVGVEPIEELVQLVCPLFIPPSCTPSFPLKACDFSHPPPHVPSVTVPQFVLKFPSVDVLALPDAAFELSLYPFEFCTVP